MNNKLKDLISYSYPYSHSELPVIAKKINLTLNNAVLRKSDNSNDDKWTLDIAGGTPEAKHLFWKNAFDLFFSGNNEMTELIEFVRFANPEQYSELNMCFVEKLNAKDLPTFCHCCNKTAPNIIDYRGRYPSFSSKVEWFKSEHSNWSFKLQLLDTNLPRFDPMFSNTESEIFEHPKVVISEFKCPECSKKHHDFFMEMLKEAK